MDLQETQISKPKITHKRVANPFPGLRPFTIDESHLFFGREGQSDEVLKKLAENKFVAVIGTSGSGKSSLMQCGLIPILYGGFMAQAGSEWNVITTRPGIHPVNNLAEAMFLADASNLHKSAEDKANGLQLINAIVNSSSYGLVDAVRCIKNLHGKNTLIIIDQFEELFRFRRHSRRMEQDQAAAFINLIIDAVYQSDEPIYVALTMRSDFIGECSQFPELTELINHSHYLIPQMNRDQQRMVVEGPIHVAAGKISQRLVQQLLNDVGDNQDQLPVLQHALMRTWDYWVQHREEEAEIDIRHYNAIGTISEALSQHADEAYEELDKEDKDICEALFKSMTEKGPDNIGIRRPTTPENVAKIAHCRVDDVIRVIDKFRQPGRSLLMPPAGTEIQPDTIIEISHESLMRIWIRLRNWVEEESDSAEMYLRISEAAAMYQIGKTGLWRPPDLQLALNWRKKQNPTREWAERYDDTFERAMVFVDTSKMAYDSEQRNQELLQRKRLRRARFVALLLGSAAVITLIFFIFGVIQTNQAKQNLELAMVEQQKAREEQAIAENERQEAEQQRMIAKANADTAQLNFLEAEAQRQRAILNAMEAENQRMRAERQAELAKEARDQALANQQFAERKSAEATRERDKAQRLLLVNSAQSLAGKSTKIIDEQLKGLLAKQAYNFHDESGEGYPYDRYLYESLYEANKALQGDNFNKFGLGKAGHQRMADVVDVIASKDGNTVYSTGTDGKILYYKLNQNATPRMIYFNGFENIAMALDKSERWLVNIGEGTVKIQVHDLKNANPEDKPLQLFYHKEKVLDVVFHPDKPVFYTGDILGEIKSYDFEKPRDVAKVIGRINVMTVHPNGKLLMAGTEQGDIYAIDLEGNNSPERIHDFSNPIHALSFNHKGTELACGFNNGRIKLIQMSGREQIRDLSGQTGIVTQIVYSSNDLLVAAANSDHSVQLWSIKNIIELPILLDDHPGYVFTLAFSPDDNHLYTGTRGSVKVWSVNLSEMANDLCNFLERNLTPKEWRQYIGNELDYEQTCDNLSGIVKH